MSKQNLHVSVFILFIIFIANVDAAIITWDNDASDNNWYNPVNWSNNSYPGDGDQRIVDIGAPATSLDVNISDGGSVSIENPGVSATIGNLYAGNSGEGTLSINNGGSVSSVNSYIANDIGSIGQVTVEGTNSSWSASQRIRVGYYSEGTLDITNGGHVSSLGGTIGRHDGAFGTVNVDGADSQWMNNQTIYVGNYGDGILNITSGGLVSSWDTNIARHIGSQGAVLVNGVNSTWSIAGSAYVGGDEVAPGGNGELTISNDGSVAVSNSLGVWDSGTISLTNGSLTVGSGPAIANTLKVYSTGSLNIDGGTVDVHSLDVSQAGAFNFNYGKLIINGGTLTPQAGDMTISRSGELAVLEMKNGSNAIISGYLSIGGDGSNRGNGSLSISGGSQVSNTNATIGRVGSGVVLVDGPGSLWDNSGNLTVGGYSSGDGLLSVTNGGLVKSAGAYIGDEVSNGGSVLVDGEGSRWENAGGISIGDESYGDLTIRNGGTVTNTGNLLIENGSYITVSSGSTLTSSGITIGLGDSFTSGGHPIVTIEGAGSSWINSGTLNIAHAYDVSIDGSLVIRDGAVVTNYDAFIGLAPRTDQYYDGCPACADGEVTVDGVGSSWTTNGTLTLGYAPNGYDLGLSDADGTLRVTNSATVTSETAILSSSVYSSGYATVTNPGSTWTNTGSMYIGGNTTAAGYYGSLNVNNGGQVIVGDTLKVWNTGALNVNGGNVVTQSIDFEAGSTFNFINGTVTVDGGMWTQTEDDLVIAGLGPADQPTLRFINGATTNINEWITVGDGAATNGALEILSGSNPIADKVRIGNLDQSNGSVVVDGIGSILTTRGLAVGWAGDASLAVTGGGQVAVNPSIGWGGIAYESTSTATVDISGIGSQLSSWDFRVGSGGHGEMNIVDQGSALFTTLYVGGGPQDHHYGTGRLAVDGAGSNVSVSEVMTIGYDGVGEMYITAGATVNSVTSYIDTLAASEGNVTVEGLGSKWINSGSMYLGGDGSLTVATGGLVDVGGVLNVEAMGMLSINGGTLSVRSLNISDGGTFDFNYGRLTIDGGTFTAASLDVSGIRDQFSEQAYMEVNNGATVNLSGGLAVGFYSGDGQLLITGGSQVFNTGSTYIGVDAWGDVMVDGLGSLWDISGPLTVGDRSDGSGWLSVTNGAVVRCTGAQIGDNYSWGSGVSVSGAGSRWEITGGLVISDESYSDLIVRDGGVVTASGIYNGYEGVAEIEVTGHGSQLNSDYSLSMDDIEATITDGGLLTSNGAQFGSNYGDSYVTVDGPDSTWINYGSLDIGIAQGEYTDLSSRLQITNGGYVSNTDARIAAVPTETIYDIAFFCSVIVDGPDSTWMNNGTLTLGDATYGDDAAGDLDITNGGRVFNTDAYLGVLATGKYDLSRGTVLVDGDNSIWDSSGSIYVGGDKLGSGGEGSVTVRNNGQVIVDGVLKIWNSGQLSGDGLVTGNVNSQGRVSPGNSVGTLTINGEYQQQAGGTLFVELAEYLIDEADLLDITGIADLAGTLEIVLFDSFVAMPGDTFEILTASLVEGNFDQVINSDETYPGLIFTATNTGSAVTITADALPGDANLDGQVNLLDLDILGHHYRMGSGMTWLQGDYNGSGTVTLIDLDIMARHWGETIVPIPEPSGVILLGLGCLGIIHRRL